MWGPLPVQALEEHGDGSVSPPDLCLKQTCHVYIFDVRSLDLPWEFQLCCWEDDKEVTGRQGEAVGRTENPEP